MFLDKDPKLLIKIVEEGVCVVTYNFYYSKKYDNYDKVVRKIYSFEGREYPIIMKNCDKRINSIEDQVNILTEGQKMGFHTPTLYVNKGNDLYMFDITKNEEYYLIDMGVGGVLRRISDLKNEGDNTYFFIGDQKICFEDLSNFAELMLEVPAKLARFRRLYYDPSHDPFMWLIKEGTGLLYLIDVEDARKEKPEMIHDPTQSSYEKIGLALTGKNIMFNDPVLDIISKKPEKRNRMNKIFLEEFIHASRIR
ncbi:MAG: hypothetical protein ABIC04_05130 [Nanoarchaeota archaeon]